MRVVIAHSRYRSAAPSGENVVVDRESAALRDAGHDVLLFERRSDDIETWSAIQKARLPLRSIRNGDVREDLARLLRDERADVLHVHNTFPMLSPSVLLAARDAGVPVVATLHNYKLVCASGDLFRNGQPCHDCLDGKVRPALLHGCYRGSRAATAAVTAGSLVNRAAWRDLVSAYVFISASQRDLMHGLRLPSERVFVKHNAVADQPASAHRVHRAAYVGRLDAAKGVLLLMRAWDLFRSALPDSQLRLAIAGDGPLAGQVASWAARHASVEVLGHLTPSAAKAVLAESTAAVVPSAWEETFGLVAIEAMAAGTAPVVPSHGSFPELVSAGVDGATFRPNDPDDLARVLGEVDADPERFVRCGAAGRATHADRFGPARDLERLLEIYRFAVENPVVPRSDVAESSGPLKELSFRNVGGQP